MASIVQAAHLQRQSQKTVIVAMTQVLFLEILLMPHKPLMLLLQKVRKILNLVLLSLKDANFPKRQRMANGMATMT